MVNKKPLVEIIILSYKNLEILKNCLNSLKKNKYSNLKITLVNQGASKEIYTRVKKDYPGVNVFQNKNNDSFARANNKILKKSKAKYCILLNDDTEQNPNWIDELVTVAESDTNIAAIQPKILSMKNKDYFDYAGGSGGYLDVYGYPLCRGRVFNALEKDKGQYDDKKEIFWASGAAILVRKSVLNHIGYLDEFIGSYAEEVDLCWRINLAGYKVVVAPNSIVYHLGSATWGRKENTLKKEFLLHKNHWLILLKNYSLFSLLKIVPIKLCLELISIIGGLILKRPRKSLAIIFSSIWLIYSFGKIISLRKKVYSIRKITDENIQDKMVRTSIALRYFLLGEKSIFKDYLKYIKSY